MADGATTAEASLTAITTYLHANAPAGHGLTYDSAGRGGSAYIISNKFELTDYIIKGRGSVVNCYDQAGGVYVLSRLLGINSEFVFMGRRQTGYTTFNGKPPFGYINAVNLVGEGTCNNPFYPRVLPPNNIKLLDGGASNKTYPERSSFGNHAFVRHNALIYDACALYLGVGNLVAYANASIDVSSSLEQQESPDGTGTIVGETWAGNEDGILSDTEVNFAVDSTVQMIQGVE